MTGAGAGTGAGPAAGSRSLCPARMRCELLRLFSATSVETRVWQLKRVMDFPSAGDLWLISTIYADGTVAALEELIGSHGGLGGFQTQPFVLFPAEWHVEEDDLVGAAAVYRQFKQWLALLSNRRDGAE